MKKWKPGIAFAVLLCLLLLLYAGERGQSQEQEIPACHSHGDGCYDPTGGLICGYADYRIHSHGEQCYDENGDLRCGMPEVYTPSRKYFRPSGWYADTFEDDWLGLGTVEVNSATWAGILQMAIALVLLNIPKTATKQTPEAEKNLPQ